jgi:very-short-patch-repair endonuclease
MKKRKIILYNPKLKEYARELRNNSTEAEIYLWLKLKSKQIYGYDFHRQKPIDNYILDFFCHELMLGIEVDGYSHELIEVYKKDVIKERKMNELGISILRFTDYQVKKDMINVLRAIEYFIFEFEKHTPNPSQEGN